MAKSVVADRIPGARELSAEELKLLAAQRQAVFELMKEGRDLYLKHEKSATPSHELIEIIRGWIGNRLPRGGG